MNIRLLTTPLLATGLLLSAVGCSKKEDATPAPNTGSYQLDSIRLSGQATASLSGGSIGSTRYDFLEVNLLPTSQNAEGIERLKLLFYKVPGSPAATYLLNNLSLYTKGNTAPYNFASSGFTLSVDSDGSFSGAFSGRVQASSSMIPGPYTTITNGVFIKVRP
jgi:hypothetical protein